LYNPDNLSKPAESFELRDKLRCDLRSHRAAQSFAASRCEALRSAQRRSAIKAAIRQRRASRCAASQPRSEQCR
jgi:hypothetical protein